MAWALNTRNSKINHLTLVDPLGKSRLRYKSKFVPEHTKSYHWYEEGRLSCLEVYGESLRIVLHPFLSKDLSRPTKKQREKFPRLRREATDITRIRVVTLLEACELLGISPAALERMKLFKRDYPISLAQPSIYKLMTHLINEGYVFHGKGTRSFFYNLDMSLHDKVSPGQIPYEMRYMIRTQPFPLLRDEINILEKSGIETNTHLTSLYKSKKRRVTVEWRVTWEGPEPVKRYEDIFGFLAGSKVEKRFKLIWRLYEEYKDRSLSQDDLDYIERQLASV